MDLDNLKLLEAKITKIVERHDEVRREKEALAQRLKEKELQVGQLASQLKQHEQERKEMRSRLERLLSRLSSVELA